MQSLKKYLFIGLMAAVAGVSLTMPEAHAQGAGAVATIPFNFSMGSMQFQAGDYRLQTEGSLGLFLALSRIGGDTKFSMLSPGVNDDGTNRDPYLVFHRYGTEVFLTRVVFSHAETYDLPRTSREKEILAGARSGDQVEIPVGSGR